MRWRATKAAAAAAACGSCPQLPGGAYYESSVIDIGAGVFVLGHKFFFMSVILGQNTKYVFHIIIYVFVSLCF